jgi:hypothetical protein
MATLGARPAVVVTDETTVPELVECLVNLNDHARRAQHIIGTEDYPSEWDRRSARADAVLDEILTRSPALHTA